MTTTVIYTPDLFGVSPTLDRADGVAQGERRKDAALELLRARRWTIVRRVQRALLLRLLDQGTATADDVRAAVELPDDIDPRCIGSVPGALAQAGIIRRIDFRKSARPERHACFIAVWTLADREAAEHWLRFNPEMEDRRLPPPGLRFEPSFDPKGFSQWNAND